jgi:hypothetical protein
VSLASADPEHWGTTAQVASTMLRALLGVAHPLVPNLNVSDLPPPALCGLRRARLAGFGAVQMTITDIGKGYVQSGRGRRPRCRVRARQRRHPGRRREVAEDRVAPACQRRSIPLRLPSSRGGLGGHRRAQTA